MTCIVLHQIQRGRRWGLTVEPGGWRWMEAAPTFLPVFDFTGIVRRGAGGARTRSG